MRKTVCGIAVAVAIVLGVATPSDAHRYVYGAKPYVGARVWVGPGIWWGSRAFWGPYWWGYPYPYAAPPVVIQQPAPTYVEPAPPNPEPYYWYYCRERQAYYPYVQQCPSEWLKVVPSAPPAGR
jgi:hypothetical protein